MLDIVIVSYGTKALTLECIESVKRHTQLPHRIIVVDNKSLDDSVEALRKTSGITLIESVENLGYGRACNQGARAGDSPYIIFLNSDIQAVAGWATPIVACFEEGLDIAVVGPKLLSPEGRIHGAGVVGTNAKPDIRGWLEQDKGQFSEQIDCISVCGAAFAVKRSNIPVLGMFDERYFFYYEETDYCYNARSKGYRVVYCPVSTMIHHHQGSCKDNGLLGRYFSESDRLFRQKWAHMMGGYASLWLNSL